MKTLILNAMIGCQDLPDHDELRERTRCRATTLGTGKIAAARRVSAMPPRVIFDDRHVPNMVPMSPTPAILRVARVGSTASRQSVRSRRRLTVPARRRELRSDGKLLRLGRDWLGRRQRCASSSSTPRPARGCSRRR